jgi:2-dehydro-3-deoxyphosphogluconate aldolase / (4S)-4-hydroxy-2-oxoglutarate aldolase
MPLFPESLQKRLEHSGIIAVLVINDVNDAVPLAGALRDGGITGIELTLRTPSAMDALRRIRAEVPEMLVGAGTVLRPAQVDEVLRAGAAFAVSPGVNPAVLKAARESGLPFAPGVCTPTDIEIALENEASLFKFFPAEPCGGLRYMRTIAAPFLHLGVRFLPLGEVDTRNASDYLRDPLVAAIGGS